MKQPTVRMPGCSSRNAAWFAIFVSSQMSSASMNATYRDGCAAAMPMFRADEGPPLGRGSTTTRSSDTERGDRDVSSVEPSSTMTTCRSVSVCDSTDRRLWLRNRAALCAGITTATTTCSGPLESATG